NAVDFARPRVRPGVVEEFDPKSGEAVQIFRWRQPVPERRWLGAGRHLSPIRRGMGVVAPPDHSKRLQHSCPSRCEANISFTFIRCSAGLNQRNLSAPSQTRSAVMALWKDNVKPASPPSSTPSFLTEAMQQPARAEAPSTSELKIDAGAPVQSAARSA